MSLPVQNDGPHLYPLLDPVLGITKLISRLGRGVLLDRNFLDPEWRLGFQCPHYLNRIYHAPTQYVECFLRSLWQAVRGT